MYVKICGVTTVEDALMVAREGADMIGLNFWPRSKRHISLQRAEDIAVALADAGQEVELVGVFVNQSDYEIRCTIDAADLDWVQLHGDEGAAQIARYEDSAIKSIPLASEDDVGRLADLPCEVVLVDTPNAGYGGSGVVSDWSLARRAVLAGDKKIILAGGLHPDNVAAAIAEVEPWAVDVATGVERAPGVKDRQQVSDFISRARSAERGGR